MGVLHGWRFCPRCAAELDLAHLPARVECPRCGFVGHANSAPTAGAVVEDGDGRILLARRAVEPYRGCWDLPGGYLLEGEHPLDGVRRELREETGLEIELDRFLGAFMDVYGDAPGASATLNLFWSARVAAGEPAPADDVSELRWFREDEVPADEELAFDLLPAVLHAWRSG